MTWVPAAKSDLRASVGGVGRLAMIGGATTGAGAGAAEVTGAATVVAGATDTGALATANGRAAAACRLVAYAEVEDGSRVDGVTRNGAFVVAGGLQATSRERESRTTERSSCLTCIPHDHALFATEYGLVSLIGHGALALEVVHPAPSSTAAVCQSDERLHCHSWTHRSAVMSSFTRTFSATWLKNSAGVLGSAVAVFRGTRPCRCWVAIMQTLGWPTSELP